MDRWIIFYNPNVRPELQKNIEALGLIIETELLFINIMIVSGVDEYKLKKLKSLKGVEAIQKEGELNSQ